MNDIIENLQEQSTLLFSVTQTKYTKDIARFGLKYANYVVLSDQRLVTLDSLQESYFVVKLEDKIATLWSFT